MGSMGYGLCTKEVTVGSMANGGYRRKGRFGTRSISDAMYMVCYLRRSCMYMLCMYMYMLYVYGLLLEKVLYVYVIYVCVYVYVVCRWFIT